MISPVIAGTTSSRNMFPVREEILLLAKKAGPIALKALAAIVPLAIGFSLGAVLGGALGSCAGGVLAVSLAKTSTFIVPVLLSSTILAASCGALVGSWKALKTFSESHYDLSAWLLARKTDLVWLFSNTRSKKA